QELFHGSRDHNRFPAGKSHRGCAVTFYHAASAGCYQTPYAGLGVARPSKLPWPLHPEMVNNEAWRGDEINLLFALLRLSLSCNGLARMRLFFGGTQAVRNMQLAGTA